MKATPTPRERARGVSSLIGYLLLFVTVISATVVLSTMGLSLVVDSGEGQHLRLAEENLARLDDGLDEVTSGAPYRAVTLQPMDASVTYGPRYTVRVTARGGGVNLTGANAIEATGRALTYDIEGPGTLSYVGGLVAYEQGDGARPVLRETPPIRTAGARLVVGLPLLSGAPRSPTLVSAARNSRLPVVLERGSANVVKRVATRTNGTMTTMTGTITVADSGVTGAWQAYFEDRFAPADIDGDGAREYAADTDGDGTLDTAGGRFRTERLYVRTVGVTVALDESV